MEEGIKIAIYIHAFFGGMGLLTGISAMILKKGSQLHKKLGKIFSLSMIISSLISLVVAWLPNHENKFLFLIGLFTIYMVLAGNRSLTFKPNLKKNATSADNIISSSMLLFSLVMIVLGILGIIAGSQNSILYLVFGSFGLLLTIRDFIFYKKFQDLKYAWLLNHISRMMGALIASVTAFIIAGVGIVNLFAWILPSIIGTVYIIFWQRKYKTKEPNSARAN